MMSNDRHSLNSAPPRRLAGDERGAIMVMGIFMCVVLVGALWFIAGIGDALVYHERLQEAADSVAFSAVTIEARGMNIIVMMNLLMATILAIRVAINLIKTVLAIAAGIFAVLGAIPLPGFQIFDAFVAPCTEGAQFMQDLDDSTRQVIDDALVALNGAEQVVKNATPIAAWGGLVEMAGKYGNGGVIFGSSVLGMPANGSSGGGWGLPIEDGTLDKLCSKAGWVVGALIGDFLTFIADQSGLGKVPFVDKAMSAIGDIIGKLANAGGNFFCELQGGGAMTPPDTSSITGGYASQACDGKKQDVCDKASAAYQQWQTDMTNFGYTNGSPGPNTTSQQQTIVGQDQATYNDLNDQCNNFDMNKCQQQQQQQMQQGQKNPTGNGSQNSGGGQDQKPARVVNSWHNGCYDAQIAAQLRSGASLQYSAKMVDVAAGGKRNVTSPQNFQSFSWSQAEMFYDCPGAWTSGGGGPQPDPNGCDAGDEATWNFHWRGRFRLLKPETKDIGADALFAEMAASEVLYRIQAGEDMARAASAPGALSLQSLLIKAEITGVILNPTTPLTLH